MKAGVPGSDRRSALDHGSERGAAITVVSQRAGVFHAGWMVVGVALLVTVAMGWNAQGLDSSVI